MTVPEALLIAKLAELLGAVDPLAPLTGTVALHSYICPFRSWDGRVQMYGRDRVPPVPLTPAWLSVVHASADPLLCVARGCVAENNRAGVPWSTYVGAQCEGPVASGRGRIARQRSPGAQRAHASHHVKLDEQGLSG